MDPSFPRYGPERSHRVGAPAASQTFVSDKGPAGQSASDALGRITGGGFYPLPGLAAAALFGGVAITNPRAYVASIHDRAQQDARRRIGEERLRSARDLHDVVAHTMATINVQAGTAAHVLTNPRHTRRPAADD